ncbi:unnamed protein product [Nippostrongylus brasiliensis]|uniref:Nuclear hormone receptor family member nhr-25 (inferred by orthology to a C. elegans protein) n=1 Tax=Nippostrongylus brasiliensis TaxID=27835 RepID=A0A0N4XTB5_NIPBR|nr:unnamed protein product [Nippostrongylus brasiliensis]
MNLFSFPRYVYRTLDDHRKESVRMKNDLPTGLIALMGYHVHINKWTELIGRLHALGFDRCDYAAFKFLALYQKIEDQVGVQLKNAHHVLKARQSLLSSWGAYRGTVNATLLPHYEVFVQMKTLAHDSQRFLMERSVAGEIGLPLLSEMLNPVVNRSIPNYLMTGEKQQKMKQVDIDHRMYSQIGDDGGTLGVRWCPLALKGQIMVLIQILVVILLLTFCCFVDSETFQNCT